VGAAFPVRGGPADGERWAADWGQVLREVEWGDVRYVYRLVGEAGSWLWEFVGDDAHRCRGCGAIVEVPRAEPCPLCGAEGPGQAAADRL
jgi:rubrerythrin